jgi:hypothetical protein
MSRAELGCVDARSSPKQGLPLGHCALAAYSLAAGTTRDLWVTLIIDRECR